MTRLQKNVYRYACGQGINDGSNKIEPHHAHKIVVGCVDFVTIASYVAGVVW